MIERVPRRPEETSHVRRGWRRPVGRAVLVGCLLVWLPALMFGIALAVGNLAECELSEAEVRPCVIGGFDLGLPLTVMSVMGWIVLALLPFMALTLGIGRLWAAVRIRRHVRHAVRAQSAQHPTDASR